MRLVFALLVCHVLCQEVDSCRYWQQRVKSFIYKWLDPPNEKTSPNKKRGAFYNLFDATNGGLKKDIPDIPIFEAIEVYTDFGGCYERGESSSYRGEVSLTKSGKQCSEWSKFIDLLHQRLQSVKKNIKREEDENLSSKNEPTKKELFAAVNASLGRMEAKGLSNHNYCRDPDNTGKPWCLVVTSSKMLWEPCAVPECTVCWRMRQRARKFFHIPSIMKIAWVPSCTADGAFSAIQCWDEYCWCSDREGTIIRGTLSKKIDGKPYCGVNFQMAVPRFKAKQTTEPQPHGSLKVKLKIEKKTLNREIKGRKSTEAEKRKYKKKITKLGTLRQPQDSRQGEENKKKSKAGTLAQRTLKKPKFQTVNCTYETSKPYKINHLGKMYTCRMTYMVMHVMKCVTIKVGQRSEASDHGFDSQFTEQCLVEMMRQVHSWRCSRQVNDVKWYSFSFKRTNRTMALSRNMTSFVGMSFLCARGERDQTIRCNATSKLLTLIFTRKRGGKNHRCVVSYKNRIMESQKCVEITKKRQRN